MMDARGGRRPGFHPSEMRMNGPIALHDWLVSKAIRPALELGRGLLPRHRGVYRAFRTGLQFRRMALDWPVPAREAWILQRLRETVRYAYDTTPYYRRRWEEIGFDPRSDFDWQDFARLPVLTRADIHTHGVELRSRAVPEYQSERNSTGGSTGKPVTIWMGPEERGWRASGAEHSMRLLGVGEGARRAMLWGHHLDPVAQDSLRVRLSDALMNRRWYDCLRLSPEQLQAYDRDLRRYRPDCIVAYASSLAALANEVERSGPPIPNYPTRCMVTGAEKLYEQQRAVIERVFRRPVHERYGGRDVGDMAFQYRAGPSLHYDVDWPLVLVEPETTAAEPSLLVTKLHGDGMPMIRYMNDDLARFPEGSSPGRPVFRLEEVIGRRADRIILPGGRWLNGLTFPHLLKDYPLTDFQVHQSADLSVIVRLVPSPAFHSGHLAAVEATVRANLPGLPIEFAVGADVQRTKANKWRPVISEATA